MEICSGVRRRRPLRYLTRFFAIAYALCFIVLALHRTESQKTEHSEWKLRSKGKAVVPAAPGSADPMIQNLSADSGADFTPPFGFVMRDFARRVLSRHISSSNVLVVAPDSVAAAKDGIQSISMKNDSANRPTKNPYDTVDFQSPYSIGGTFLLHAAAEGHQIHAFDFGFDQGKDIIDSERTLDDWWQSFGKKKDNSVTRDSRWWSSSTLTPKWIIAAIIDCVHPTKLDVADKIWTGFDRFLNESTITYLVVGMQAKKVEGQYQFGGLAAASPLLQRRYKLQVLLVSHYHVSPGKEAWTEERYGPNALLRSVEQVKEMLRWGADAANMYGSAGQAFTAYLFATQGLDLAIPSSQVYLLDSSRVIGEESTLQVNLYKPLQLKPCSQASVEPKLDVLFTELLGETSVFVEIPLGNTTSSQRRHYHHRAPADLGFSYEYDRGERGQHRGPKPEAVDLWISNSDYNKAEAVCARLDNYTRCTTRVIETDTLPPKANQVEREKVPSILLILIDPISQQHFKRTMPKSVATLKELGFINFGNYTSVGPNSGKNQAALYSGIPLANRDGIKKNAEGGKWLWDRLRAEGFVTLKTEDGCILNSNMVRSLEPNTTHGKDLNDMFCFDFNRPNCVGPNTSAQLLLNYGKQFLNTYESRRKKVDPSLRWAALLHFIDTHEDSMVLSSMLDADMSSFLEDLSRDMLIENAFVIFTSDHGLHYGPYFQSTSGERERVQPILNILVPTQLQSKVNFEALRRNANAHVTPFDVHETILSLLASPNADSGERKGKSLLDPLPMSRSSCSETAEIPQSYCDLKNGRIPPGGSTSCTRMPRPPSVLSFYSDIPISQRPIFSLDCKQMGNKTASHASFQGRCQCATSHRGWHKCGEHPWGPTEMQSNDYPEEYFALVKCRGHKMTVDTRAGPGSGIPPFLQHKQSDLNGNLNERRPNILFLEIDSVSMAYADRHFPLTRSLLKRFRHEDKKGIYEDDAFALEFKTAAIVGPNSITNQIAALSGCLVTRIHDDCFDHGLLHQDRCSNSGMFLNSNAECEPCPKGKFLSDPLSRCTSINSENCCTSTFPSYNTTRICKDQGRLEFGLQLFRRGPRRHATYCPILTRATGKTSSPWLFDVAKTLGYVSYFGDEFCYEGSPFVAQGNVFPLSPHFDLQTLYCRLEESRQYNFSASGPLLCARQRLATEEKPTNPGLDLIRQLWTQKSLSDVPKFVYLNAMAAHDYSPDWIRMISVSEQYDRHLATFLSSIILDKSFSNTVIIVRADHGLQGGPMTMEYSMQVEHREPWTEIIVPTKRLGSDSLKVLHLNQERMITGHDIYRTLRELMDPSGKLKMSTPVPHWAYSLIHDTVPRNRTCIDAKVPADFCPCEEQILHRPPSFGVCNVFDQYGDLFCVDKDDVILPDNIEVI